MQNDATRHAEWVRLFLDTLKKHTIAKHVDYHEGYKFYSVDHFLRHFDIDATDLAGNLEDSIVNNNLVAGAMYFPRKMLTIFATEFTEETRALLHNLFDESKDVHVRINETVVGFEELEAKRAVRNGTKPSNTYISLRFVSLLLGFRYPDTYNPLKPAEWKVFASFMNPEFSMPRHTPPGEQYRMYNEYIESLREYIATRPEIQELRTALTEGLSFKDEEFRWTTQDVIFVTARAYADLKASESTPQAEDIDQAQGQSNEYAVSDTDDTGFMALESHLEEYVVRNWEHIDFGEDLTMYVSEDGTTGQQYTTDVGILDILARDSKGDYVVIELKRADSKYHVVGQILNYIGWVKENLATESQNVRGIIIVGKADKTLLSALKPVSNIVKLKEYQVLMTLKDVG